MTERYGKTLRLLDFGRRVKAMFRFVPIEGLDEQSFFGGEGENDEAELIESDAAAEKEKPLEMKENLKKREAGVFGKERQKEKKAKTENAVDKAASEGENRLEKEWADTERISDKSLERKLENTAEKQRMEAFWNEAEESGQKSDTVILAEKGMAGYSPKNSAAERVFDEGEWLAGDSVYSTGENGREMTQMMTAERIIEPAAIRIERSAERIERSMAQAAERLRFREMEEDERFKERLEGVLRAEIMRNGFDMNDI